MADATQEICCPQFNPALWDDKILEWKDRRFIKDKVFTLFYMPVNFGAVMRRLDAHIRKAGAEVLEGLALSEHTSRWNMDVYVAVDKEIPGATHDTLSGKFYSKVYEGPFRDTGKWSQHFAGLVRSKGHTVKKLYMWYTTCPKCARKYGKNYVALIAEIA